MARPTVVVEFQPGSDFLSNTLNIPLTSIRRLTDTFDGVSLNLATWDVSTGTPTVSAGALHLPATSGGTVVITDAFYDLTNGSVRAELSAVAPGGSGLTGFSVQQDVNHSAGFEIGPSNITARLVNVTTTASATAAYSAVNHRHLRIRETSGMVYWETSPDGSTWSTLLSAPSSSATWKGTVKVRLASFGSGAGEVTVPAVNPQAEWVDISDRVRSVETRTGREDDLAEHPPGEATVVLSNHDRTFDPDNADGPYAGLLLPRVPFRIRAIDSSLVSHDLFYGFVEGGWEQSYAPPAESLCTVTLVDLVAVLNGMVLTEDYYSQVVVADGPKAYWKLTDTGSVAIDSSGHGWHGNYRNGPTLEADGILFGQGARKFDGISTAVDITDPGARIKTDNLSSYTVEAWIRPEGLPTPTQHGTIFQQSGANTFYAVDDLMTIVYDWTSQFYSEHESPGSGGYNRTAAAGWSGPMHIVFTMDSATSDDDFYVNGVEQTVGLGFLSDAFGTVRNIVIGGNPAAGNTTHYFNGLISHVAIYQRALSEAEIDEHYAAGMRPLDGQRTDERIEWILNQVGVSSDYYDLDVGLTRLGPGAPSGEVLAAIRQVVATEQGSFYVDHANGGVLRFKNRYSRLEDTRSTVSQVTFSDEDTTGVYHYERDSLSIESNGVASIINQVQVSWLSGEVTVQNADSIAAYGARGISLSTIAADPGMAQGVGEWIVGRYAEPLTRVTGLALSGADTSNYDAIISLQNDDRCTLRRHPQEVGDPITQAVYIEGTRHLIEPNNRWRTEYYLSNAVEGNWFTWGVSEWGGSDGWAY